MIIGIAEIVSKEMRSNFKLIIASIASYERRKLQNYQIFHVFAFKTGNNVVGMYLVNGGKLIPEVLAVLEQFFPNFCCFP